MAYRYLGNEDHKKNAINSFKQLLKKHYIDGKLCHSSLGSEVQKNEFLEDYAALLLLTTFIFEETGEYKELLFELEKKIKTFKKNYWITCKNEDFIEVPAADFDHPTPSAVSMAELALLRVAVMLNREYLPGEFKYPMHYDFFNYMMLMRNGHFHVIHTPQFIPWQQLPLNTIQIKSQKIQDCYDGECKEFKSVEELIKNIKNVPTT